MRDANTGQHLDLQLTLHALINTYRTSDRGAIFSCTTRASDPPLKIVRVCVACLSTVTRPASVVPPADCNRASTPSGSRPAPPPGRCQQHTRRAALDQQRRRAQPQPAQPARDRIATTHRRLCLRLLRTHKRQTLRQTRTWAVGRAGNGELLRYAMHGRASGTQAKGSCVRSMRAAGGRREGGSHLRPRRR